LHGERETFTLCQEIWPVADPKKVIRHLGLVHLDSTTTNGGIIAWRVGSIAAVASMAMGHSVTSGSSASITYQDYIRTTVLCFLIWVLVLCDALQSVLKRQRKNAVRIGGFLGRQAGKSTVDGG
jgi:hypothetical protein